MCLKVLLILKFTLKFTITLQFTLLLISTLGCDCCSMESLTDGQTTIVSTSDVLTDHCPPVHLTICPPFLLNKSHARTHTHTDSRSTNLYITAVCGVYLLRLKGGVLRLEGGVL